jgi:hypothetical protein
MDAIVRALRWCGEQQMDVINLSLGTANEEHREIFVDVLDGLGTVISAAEMLPGSLPGVVGVAVDEDCPRDEYRVRDGIYFASPYPRPIEGLPPKRNLRGVSFAVANVTGLVARKGGL